MGEGPVDERIAIDLAWDAPMDWLRDDSFEDWLSEKGETATAAITAADEDDGKQVELYDSGATRHISANKVDFTSYAPLSPPVFLNTANQQRFQAIGLGSLVI